MQVAVEDNSYCPRGVLYWNIVLLWMAVDEKSHLNRGLFYYSNNVHVHDFCWYWKQWNEWNLSLYVDMYVNWLVHADFLAEWSQWLLLTQLSYGLWPLCASTQSVMNFFVLTENVLSKVCVVLIHCILNQRVIVTCTRMCEKG